MSMFRNMMLASMRKRRRVPGFVGGWRGYGRSNSEDASTRDILPDYSGNGRDIQLYNFGFAGMSGYGGYRYDSSNTVAVPSLTSYCKIEGNKIEITNLSYSNNGTVCYARSIYGEYGQPLSVNVPAYKIKVSGLSEGQRVDIGRGYSNGVNTTWVNNVISSIYDDGIYEIPAWNTVIEPVNEEVRASISDFSPAVVATEDTPANVVIEILPDYPGALVSDGIDDYGQCVKDFALPDDYTVVAIRQKLVTAGPLAGKSRDSSNGAFIFEEGGASFSYGIATTGLANPKLFSYQTKSTYNGQEINVGTGTDTEEDKFTLFKRRSDNATASSYILYDLRIYDHSLTAEELQIVKDEMMADFVKNTGVLDGIDYYDIIDCHGRSNEDGDRNRLVGRLGNLHLNLNNFGYAAGSGWNGYWQDFNLYTVNFGNSATAEKFIFTTAARGVTAYCSKNNMGTDIVRMKIKVAGLTKGIQAEEVQNIRFYFSSGSTYQTISSDGIYDIDLAFPKEGNNSFYILVNSKPNSEVKLTVPITIEQLPTHPGSLVFDGVDDYAVSEEALTEPVGAFAVMYNLLKIEPTGEHYIFASNFAQNIRSLFLHNTSLKWIALDSFSAVKNNQVISDNLQINYAIRTVDEAISNGLLTLGSNTPTYGQANAALYQLRLIKNRPTDIQMEVVKWQMDKEHRDWMKKNGYDIDEQ